MLLFVPLLAAAAASAEPAGDMPVINPKANQPRATKRASAGRSPKRNS